MSVLSADLRRTLERAVLAGRGVAEAAAASAVARLGVGLRDAPTHLTTDEKAVRVALRARARQLGDNLDKSSDPGDVEVACPLLVSEVAYEQWHRFLFARFLEANGLLHHPEYGVAVTLVDCEELAESLGEPDGWSVAARFAAQVLPGIFKPSDPAVRTKLAREDLIALEKVVVDIPDAVFSAEDSLGWVYQFWQSKAKKDVNDSGRKVGGADLSPVTQLFTENYMVRFLLENTLGAWWAARNPGSRLLEDYDFLRYDEGGEPAAGTYEGWPESVADVTFMDPCCGSGHFLVAAFGMLWRMRAEANGLSPAAAQDAVLRDNLFGLELDPRCAQIAMFALALEAWKQGGYRLLPTPQVACSGIPSKAPLSDWTKLAEGDELIESALTRLHSLFVDADTWGSLIDPVRATEQAGLESVEWTDVSPLVQTALRSGADENVDPASAVFGDAASGIARVAYLLSRTYTVVATNPPYLGVQRMPERFAAFIEDAYPTSSQDLATVFIERCQALSPTGTTVVVSPLGWLFLRNYREMRKQLLSSSTWNVLAPLGKGAFATIGGHVVQVALLALSKSGGSKTLFLDATGVATPAEKAESLRQDAMSLFEPAELVAARDTLLALGSDTETLLSSYATSWQGLVTGDVSRFVVGFWEVATRGDVWAPFVSAPGESGAHAGRQSYLRYEGGRGSLHNDSRAHNFNPPAVLQRRGVLIAQSAINATLYEGEMFNDASAPIIPNSDSDLPALWAYLSSPEYVANVRKVNQKVIVAPGYLLKVPFDVERWRGVAADQFPDGLPKPWSDDASQWLFNGDPSRARQALQTAVGRLVAFRWPEQAADAVDEHVDSDGIVCLPAVAGEQAAAERVRAVLASTFGAELSSSRLDALLVEAGGRPGDLAGWLAGTFFKDHCKVFGNRPFVWHIWDGLKDGFSALVNYHRLDRATLEKLTYRTLGWWIDRQRADAESGVLGAGARLGAGQALQAKLQLILAGEPPYDIYVRWKGVAEQPIGWEPDIDDGVRMNIRPFMEAGVLRTKPAIHWKKDRGANPDGSERHNDLHVSVAEKRKARGLA